MILKFVTPREWHGTKEDPLVFVRLACRIKQWCSWKKRQHDPVVAAKILFEVVWCHVRRLSHVVDEFPVLEMGFGVIFKLAIDKVAELLGEISHSFVSNNHVSSCTPPGLMEIDCSFVSCSVRDGLDHCFCHM